jgi:transposase-like protein
MADRNSRTSARRVQAQENRRKAVELRRAGASFSQIAAQLGMAKSSAHKAVSKALAEIRGELDEQARLLQAQEADRLDALQTKMWTRAIGGDVIAIDKVLRIMERRARLLGLDQPQKVAPTTPEGDQPYQPGQMSDAEMDARIAELEAKHRGDERR